MTTLLKTPGTSQGTTQRAPDQEVGPAHRPDPDGPPVVVRDVRRSYGDREVLHGVDLVVERGSFHGVIGSNGAGKTTLMEIVHGARRPRSGTVELLGRPPLPRDPALLARLGIQPQATAFFSRATVREHLGTMAALFGASQARADELIEIMGLERVRNSRVTKVSGGERQRLAVASAIVHHPEVLFLDEPTAALDPTSRHDLVEQLRKVREEGTTVIYTTHYLEEAERLCDVVSVLDAGHIVTTATPAALIAGCKASSSVLLPGGAQWLDTITGLEGVLDAQVTPDGVVVHVQDVGEGFAVLAAAGVPTAGAQVRGVSLEDAFVQLTGKEIQR